VQFTKTALTALALPEGKTDHVVWDDDLPGFGLRLRGDNRRWVVQYRIAGQSRRESIGDPRKVSLEDARRAARQRFGSVARGLDPMADEIQAKAEAEAARLTLGVVSERYLEARAPVVRPSTLRMVTLDLRSRWAPLHRRPIESIKRADIAARLGEITRNHGRVASARARVSLSAIAATSLAASRKRPAVPENSSLGSAPAPSIFTLGCGCCRSSGRLVRSRGAILSIAADHRDRAVSCRRRPRFGRSDRRRTHERIDWPADRHRKRQWC
jgi:hypothetical protein